MSGPSIRITRTAVVDLAAADLAEIHDLRIRSADFFAEVDDPPPTPESFAADLDDLPEGFTRADEIIYRAYGLPGDKPGGRASTAESGGGVPGCDTVEGAHGPAGYAEVLRGFPQSHQWTIGIVLVDASQRSQGVGKAIVDAVAADAAAAGGAALVVGVIALRDRSLSFWYREGFATELLRRPIVLCGLETEVVRLERRLKPA